MRLDSVRNVAPVWENSGSTPATEAEFQGTYCWRKQPLPHDFGFKPIPDNPIFYTPPTPLFVAPKGTATVGATEIPGYMLDAIKERQRILYIYGTFLYSDGISPSRRKTNFCFLVDDFIGDGEKGNGIFRRSNCWTHNCVDEQCIEQEKKMKQQHLRPTTVSEVKSSGRLRKE